ncbi:MAG TPA: 7-cyano-7-deazaguanine synthase QueC, partial [Limnobacter sp.]|nr:7-cyano-7-deazaguanine synthase QueC [Limnobacter sp.]
MNKNALVLFSGGQDSTVCLAWALSKFDHVETIGFDYGQRHRIELDCRLKVLEKTREQFPEWARKLGEDRVIDLGWLGQISDCALTEEREIELSENGLPNTFVPGRNLVFFMIASAVAYRRGLNTLVGGMCQTDFSGYPDCREDTLKALQVATNLGMASTFRFETPLMWIDKTETFQLGHQLG